MTDHIPGVHSDPDILGGTPVFVGTRVPVRALLDYLEHDRSLAEFLDDFPTVANGALLKLANGQFDALLTVDQVIEYQQNLAGLSISVVVIVAPSNDADDLAMLSPRRAAHLER